MTKEQFLAGYGLTQAVPGITIYIRLLYRSSVKRDAWGNNRNNCNFPPCFLTRYWCFTILEQREKNIIHTRRTTWSQCRCCRYFNCRFYDPIWTSTVMNASDFVFASLLLLTSFLENTTLGYRYTRGIWRIYSIHFVNKNDGMM